MKIIRKIVHITIGTGLIVFLLLFYNFTINYLVILIGIIALIGLVIDMLRMVIPDFNKFLTEKLLSFLFTNNEADGINSATFFFFSSGLCILLFDKNIAIVSIAILTYSDSFASIIGIKFGRKKFGSKTIEGTITFLIVSFFLCLIYFPICISIIVSLIITITELTSIKVDDNLSIPLITGFILTLIGTL